jgi:M6 family metalloprotease-like protein
LATAATSFARIGSAKKRRPKQNEAIDGSQRLDRLMNSQEPRGLVQGQDPKTVLCGFTGTVDQPCELKLLIVLVRFADHKDRQLPSPDDYNIFFNGINVAGLDQAPTGSVADLYRQNSYNSFSLQTKISPVWINVSMTEAEVAGDINGEGTPESKETWKEALSILENEYEYDFSKFDNDGDGVIDALGFLHSGADVIGGLTDCEGSQNPDGKRVWSHETRFRMDPKLNGGVQANYYFVSSGVWIGEDPIHREQKLACPEGGPGTPWSIARIGVISHEIGHVLGLPDLSDYTVGNGVGTFDLMCKFANMKRIHTHSRSLQILFTYQLFCNQQTHGGGTQISYIRLYLVHGRRKCWAGQTLSW